VLRQPIAALPAVAKSHVTAARSLVSVSARDVPIAQRRAIPRLARRSALPAALVPAASPALRQCASPMCLSRNEWALRSPSLHISVTRENQICRTLCWIRYRRQNAPAVLSQPRTRLPVCLAATFLKHKLWRFRNTRHRGSRRASCSASQVIDRSMFCALEGGLARLLLVGNHLRNEELKSNEDQSGSCLGSR
jgi:hypothetical protein